MKAVSLKIKWLAALEKIRWADFLELTKLRLVSLVLWSVAVGFFLASRGPLDLFLLLKTLIGTVLVAAGAMALNQLLEWESDAKMKRTEDRPLPSGRVEAGGVLWLGIILCGLGLSILTIGVNFLSGILSTLTVLGYLFIYTPMKTKSSLCVLMGAVPGAVPPMLGWAAGRGSLGIEAWILFSILFLWQLPHVLAIGWVYREDYARAGFRMISAKNEQGTNIGRMIVVYCLILLPVSILPTFFGITGFYYLSGAFLLGLWFLALGLRTRSHLNQRAKSFFRGSIVYLALLFLLMILDKKGI